MMAFLFHLSILYVDPTVEQEKTIRSERSHRPASLTVDFRVCKWGYSYSDMLHYTHQQSISSLYVNRHLLRGHCDCNLRPGKVDSLFLITARSFWNYAALTFIIALLTLTHPFAWSRDLFYSLVLHLVRISCSRRLSFVFVWLSAEHWWFRVPFVVWLLGKHL